MPDRGDILQVRSIQYGAVGLTLSALFVLAQTLTSASERLHATRAVEEFREGRIEEDAGNCPSAIQHYRTGLELADDSSYRLALARCLMKEGRASEGDTYLSQVLAGDPTSGEANLLRAGLLAHASAVDEAVLFYERAATGSWPVNDTQGRFRARRDLVELLHREKRWRELVPQLMQVRESPALSVSEKLRMASMFMDAQAPGEARDLLLAMNDAAAQALLGRAYLDLRQPRLAATAFHTAAQLAPDDATIALQAVFAQRIVALEPLELARVALGRLKRCAAFEDRFTNEVDAQLQRKPDDKRLRSLIVEMWRRSGYSCGPESLDERALEYLMTDLTQAAEVAVP